MARLNLLLRFAACLLPFGYGVAAQAENSTFHNPILPGWHSDPSCTQVDGTFYCVTSTFIAFPGLPIYASKDLINWKLASHAWSRESQLPGVSWSTKGQQDGMYAATLRYRDGEFYVICEYLRTDENILGVVFKSTDPFSDDSWSDPVTFGPHKIDPDLFWDDDGKVYAATQGIILQDLDLETGELSQPAIELWNGTGGVWPEGPHIYKKDGYYYLLIAEGGTERDHAITIARARAIDGPYEPYPNNPILTNRGTDEYFQTVGHGDLFQDVEGNWWGVALATRCGPEFQVFPMGRETVLYPVTWEEGEWPVLQPVRGEMSGWPLPPANRDLPGDGPFNSDPDKYDFAKGSPIPRNLVYWRVPGEETFSVTSRGLQVVPTRSNLTGNWGESGSNVLSGKEGLAFIGRRQTHTLFTFTVDLTFDPKQEGQEAGVTMFLTQFNHIDLGIKLLPAKKGKKPELSFSFASQGTGTPPPPQTIPVPHDWAKHPIRLQIQTVNATHYELSAAPPSKPESKIVVGAASASLLSGGAGSFVGSLVGVYATCNGQGSGTACPKGGEAFFNRWRYDGEAQYISATESIPAK
ncbi:related to xylosidase/arabinosidase [Cephalotrichum gorgonifer]|uniref:Related to xylosidase/arabinosidase n=1 Tax=Cephalotrichum gorgonifer TaxID=2041049 RepID=A0AAE8MTN7_9PEZI|nr:related to xylosidase/arabinosidase [Cephalotrichum gorgonifer]